MVLNIYGLFEKQVKQTFKVKRIWYVTWSLDGLYIGMVNVMLTGPASFVIFPRSINRQKLGIDLAAR